MIDVSVIIVSYNTRELLRRCLESLRRCSGAAVETVVVDNFSTDRSAQMTAVDFPEVKLIPNRENAGFARANNQGIRATGGRYVFCLNPDTEVAPDAIAALVGCLDERGEEVAVAAPRLLEPDGSVQRSLRRFPTRAAVLYQHTLARYLFPPLRRAYGEYKMRDFDYGSDEPADAEQPMGAALMIRRSALEEVGLFDEGFWMYFEEVDLLERIHRAGYRIVYYPPARVVHHGGASAGPAKAKLYLEFHRSLLRYFRKRLRPGRAAAFAMVYKVLFVAKAAVEAVSRVVGAAADAAARRAERSRRKLADARIRARFLTRDLVGFLLRM